ncbi:hypothetical protein C0J52_15591 [Blattella germanica]|nr:hypothetical protein C0J52_15591 [Blattella germanica]
MHHISEQYTPSMPNNIFLSEWRMKSNIQSFSINHISHQISLKLATSCSISQDENTESMQDCITNSKNTISLPAKVRMYPCLKKLLEFMFISK